MSLVHPATLSAAQQAFHGCNHHADDSVCDESIVNPVPGEPEHQENVPRGWDLAAGGWIGTYVENLGQGKKDSHGAVWPAGYRWNQ